MNVTQLLREDHGKVKALFTKFEQAGERAHKTKQGIAEQAFQELKVHTTLEEEVFYPAVRAKGGELEKMIAESLEEHHVVDVLMEELQALEPEDEAYEAKFTVLMENVRHHIQEEERELFPAVEDKMKQQLTALGEQMETRKGELKGALSR
jgi:hemerythrin superfamily protein